MKKQKKVITAIVALITLVCGCMLFIWLGPYIWYIFLVSSLSHGLQGGIHCWVKIVNQNGKVVQGYKVEITEHGGASFLPFISKAARLKYYETDADGMFEYDSKGSVGSVFFGHQDSQWTLNPKHLMDAETLVVRAFQFNEAKEKDHVNYLGSKQNPFVLHVFTVGPPQKLLYWKKRVKLEKEGNYACIDLLAGRIWESTKPEGDVAMADGQYTKGGAPRCGTRMVAGTNCSLYPVVDDWGLRPPEDGYVKELCYGKDWEDKHKIYHGIQYYYRLQNQATGKIIFGRLTLGVSPYIQNAEIQTYTNLQGKRNLYYKGYNEDPSGFYGIIRDYVSPPVQ